MHDVEDANYMIQVSGAAFCLTACTCVLVMQHQSNNPDLGIIVQDVDALTDPDNGFDGINIVAQILWQAFNTRYGTGASSLLLFIIPMGANFFSALHSITSATRCVHPCF